MDMFTSYGHIKKPNFFDDFRPGDVPLNIVKQWLTFNFAKRTIESSVFADYPITQISQ